jgi:putative endonuclease
MEMHGQGRATTDDELSERDRSDPAGLHAGGAPPPGPEPTWGHWLGRYGEQAAARYLAAAGYRVLDRNWVCRDPDLRGELDLVARYRRLVVACEVKTRAGDTLDHPVQAVTAQKALRLRLLAVRWVAEQRALGKGDRGGPSNLSSLSGRPVLATGPGLRIDVISVRTDPRPPFTVRSLDHLIGVA